MNKDKIIAETIDYVKEKLSKVDDGHGWNHVYRVWQLSKRISKGEEVDSFLVELGALLHDVVDPKLHEGSEEEGIANVEKYLEEKEIPRKDIEKIKIILKYHSFKNRHAAEKYNLKELHIVSDADKLDSLGAIGIARTFHYGGHYGEPIHLPEIKPRLEMSDEEYKKHVTTCFNHFYEKLFLLKDMMKTKTGKEIAESRHNYMKSFIERFAKEWEGKL